MDNGAAIMVRDLRKSYRDVTAVAGIDLDIGRGEVFALLGPNGAGKTTTVEILEGFRHRDQGTVTVLGYDPARTSRAWRARIGIVLQLASTGPELTVLEMVSHFAGFYPRPRRPEEAIDLVGLTAKAGSRISKLSGGQTRRLDVALGIVGRPELLFLDEPTTGFDPEARRQFWELIRTLRGVGPGTSTAPAAAPLPGVWRLGAARGAIEVKAFFRDKMAVAFIFGLPSILLILLGSIFGSQAAAHGVTVGQLFTAGMIAGGIMSTSFQYLAIGIATERENGMLKRLSGTPMPGTAYFVGKVVQVMVCTVAETVLLVAVGMLFYHLHLPTQPGRWWTFAWVFVLGSAACALTGIAASSVPRSAASATPVITLPFTVLQFVSGVYVPFNDVPRWMGDLGSVFPLKWMAQGMRSVFLPEQGAVLEPAGTWEHGRIALVLGVWIVAGLVLCTKTFRWQSRN